jgi:transposase
MADPIQQSELFGKSETPSDTIAVNARCVLRTQEGHRVVAVGGVTLAHYAVGDRMSEAHAMVSLVEQGWAMQAEVARAFQRSTRTIRRYERRYAEGGLAGLGRAGGYPRGRPRLAAPRKRLVSRLKAEGQSNRAIARRLGVSEKAVRKLLRQLGWKPAEAADPNASASSSASNASPAPPAKVGSHGGLVRTSVAGEAGFEAQARERAGPFVFPRW